MTWNVFANVSQLNTPDLDTNFSNLAGKVVFPCTASGTNAYALSTSLGDPPVTVYTSRAPIFSFVAPATSNAAVTINVNGIGAKNLYKNNGANAAGSGDIQSGGVYFVAYDATLNGAVGGFVLLNQPSSTLSAVTVQNPVGSGTYNPTAGTIRIRVAMVAGGGGGGAVTLNVASQVGGTTSLGSWTCIGGNGGGAAGPATGGTGGTGGSNGTGTLIKRVQGGQGSGGSSTLNLGGAGGHSPVGFGAAPRVTTANGLAPSANSFGGGGGGGTSLGSAGGGGGGGGEYAEFWVFNPGSLAYAAGGGGAGGTAGGQSGGAGAGGGIWIEEYPF